MIDFLRFLSPEQRARIKAREDAYARDVAEARKLSNEELAEKTKYYLSQAQFAHAWLPGEPVYDGVIAHVIIPELLRRISLPASPSESGCAARRTMPDQVKADSLEDDDDEDDEDDEVILEGDDEDDDDDDDEDEDDEDEDDDAV